jgi:hypothetical protein
MTDFLQIQIPAEYGASVRTELIAARLLAPQGERAHHAAHVVLDSDAIYATALEIVASLPLEAAREIAISDSTDHRVGAAMLDLLQLPPEVLRDRCQRPRARAKREHSELGAEQ